MDKLQMKMYVLVKTDNEQEESFLLEEEEEEVEALGGIIFVVVMVGFFVVVVLVPPPKTELCLGLLASVDHRRKFLEVGGALNESRRALCTFGVQCFVSEIVILRRWQCSKRDIVSPLNSSNVC
jgi:hypothetical protein